MPLVNKNITFKTIKIDTMSNLIEVYCENTKTTLFVEQGSSLMDILKVVGLDSPQVPVVAAYCDNYIKELDYRVFSSKSIRFISLATTEGMRVYARSLFFLVEKAISDLIPGAKMHVMYPVGRGCYAEIEGYGVVSSELAEQIKGRMRELVEQNIPFVRRKITYQKALDTYTELGHQDKVKMLVTRPRYYVSIINLAGQCGYFYGAMAPSTAYLSIFDIVPFGDGFVVLMPSQKDPSSLETMHMQPKLFDVFSLNKTWTRILGVANVGSLNEQVIKGNAPELIKVGEALQEKNFARIADHIFEHYTADGVRLVLIAGPSSSGKTTFSKRLEIQLRVLGLRPQTISLDNYFVERDRTPRDESGEYDFESIDAIDIEQFNSDLNALFDGQQVSIPRFSFQSGARFYDGSTMQLEPNDVLVVEGIHALNPVLTGAVDDKLKFKIYASALTTLSLDNMSVIHTTDNRLLRRMVRDSKYRGRSAQQTLAGWSSVRRGEDKHIFPFQEQADVMFNTSLFFELPVLKSHAMPLLEQVPANVPECAEAVRLMRFLNYFVDINDNQLPPTSILREFLGGSSFEY